MTCFKLPQCVSFSVFLYNSFKPTLREYCMHNTKSVVQREGDGELISPSRMASSMGWGEGVFACFVCCRSSRAIQCPGTHKEPHKYSLDVKIGIKHGLCTQGVVDKQERCNVHLCRE